MTEYRCRVSEDELAHDRAQDIAEQEKKARGATDYAWQTVIDTREAIQ